MGRFFKQDVPQYGMSLPAGNPKTLIQQAGFSAATSAGPLLTSITTAAGHTLIMTGHMFDQSVSRSLLPASITDTAGNIWHVSTAPAADPPTQQSDTNGDQCDFIAWTINAAAVTGVTFNNNEPADTIFYRLAISEWAGITAVDQGNGVTSGAASSSSQGAPVNLLGTNELVVTAGSFISGTLAAPPGFTIFTAAGNCCAYATGQSGLVTPAWSTNVASPGDAVSKAFF